MTVAELIKELQTLPQDMEVMVIDDECETPVEIVQVSRGSWQDDLDYDNDEFLTSNEDGGFVQDDENGKVAVLVTW